MKKYWLKGGVIAFIVILIAATISTLLSVFVDDSYAYILLYLIVFGSLPLFVLGKGCVYQDLGVGDVRDCLVSQDVFMVLAIIVSIISYILVGIFLGWIYGKIINRNVIIR